MVLTKPLCDQMSPRHPPGMPCGGSIPASPPAGLLGFPRSPRHLGLRHRVGATERRRRWIRCGARVVYPAAPGSETMVPTPPRPQRRRRRNNLDMLSAPACETRSTPRRRHRPGSYGRDRRPPLGELARVSLPDGAAEAEPQEVSLPAQRDRRPMRTCSHPTRCFLNHAPL